MEKEFNIFGEFESVEQDYLKSLEDTKVEPGEEDDDDLEETLKAAEAAAKAKAATEEDEPNEDTQHDEEDADDEEESEESKETTKQKSKESNEQDDEESQGSYSFKALANVLADEGIIDYEDSEDEEDSMEVISKAVLGTAKNMLEEYKQSLPEEGQKFLSYLERGGDPSKYINKSNTSSVLDLDISDEGNQKQIITEYLKKQDYDDDEIKEMLEDYEDGMILQKQAERASKKLEVIYAKEKDSLVKQQEAEVAEKQKAYQKQIEQLEDTIESSEDFGGIKVNKADKKALRSYMLDRDKEGLTGWQKDLKAGGTKTQLTLAYLQMKKFNFEKLTKQAATDVAKNYKKIFDNKSTTVKGRSKQVESTKGDLSAFQEVLR